MTFKECMIKAMTSRGMFKDQAVEILNEYITSDVDSSMSDRWDDRADSYPDTMQFILWIGVKHFAFKWIEKNQPQAWFRPMFEYSDNELTKMIEAKRKELVQ